MLVNWNTAIIIYKYYKFYINVYLNINITNKYNLRWRLKL